MKKSIITIMSMVFLSGCQTMMPNQAHEGARSQSKPVFLGASGNLPFSEAVKVGNTLYLSGQIGLKDGKLVPGGVAAETQQIFDNINATLVKYGYQRSDLVKCGAMLTDMSQFAAFNKAYQAALRQPYPARSTYGVPALALGASVEIECIAAK